MGPSAPTIDHCLRCVACSLVARVKSEAEPPRATMCRSKILLISLVDCYVLQRRGQPCAGSECAPSRWCWLSDAFFTDDDTRRIDLRGCDVELAPAETRGFLLHSGDSDWALRVSARGKGSSDKRGCVCMHFA